MPRAITDFTKSRLTQSFEAKGNTGSALIEDLQPVVSVYDLEKGPFSPYIRFAYADETAAVALQLPAFAIGASSEIQSASTTPPRETSIILDWLWVNPTGAPSITVTLLQSPTFDTTQAANIPINLDGREKAPSFLSSEFAITKGALLAIPVSNSWIYRGPPGAGIAIPLGVVFGKTPAIVTFPNQLCVTGSVVNSVMQYAVHGRILPVQS